MENFLIVLTCVLGRSKRNLGIVFENLEMPWRHRQIGQHPGSLSSTEIGF